MDHRARVLDLRRPQELRAEMAALGVHAHAVPPLADKGRFRAVRLANVDGRAAALLKQEMLSIGADCAVHQRVAGFDAEPRAVVLLGSRRHYERLAERAEGQPFGLEAMAREALAAVEGFDGERTPTLRCGEPIWRWSRIKCSPGRASSRRR